MSMASAFLMSGGLMQSSGVTKQVESFVGTVTDAVKSWTEAGVEYLSTKTEAQKIDNEYRRKAPAQRF